MSPAKKRKIKDTADLLKQTLNLAFFQPFDDGTIAIPYHLAKGEGKLVLVLGENASGKSFFRRAVCSIAQSADYECIHLSMEGRKNMYMASMVYGDESRQSTGANSAHIVLTGISTCRSREKQHLIFWDEPDVGLSDSWAAGAGVAIRDFTLNPPEKTKAIFVVTHSRPLVKELLPANPHYLCLGDDDGPAPKTLLDWLERPIVPRKIEDLSEVSHRRFHKILKILKEFGINN